MDPLKGVGLPRGLDSVSSKRVETAEALGRSGNEKQIKKAAVDFEAMLVNQMLKSMWETVPKDTLFGGNNETDIYRDMYSEALSKDIAENQSFGVQKVVIKELTKK